MNYNWSDSFRKVLADAIADMAATGYVSRERIDQWIVRLRNVAERDLGPESQIDEATARQLGMIFERLAEKGGIERYVPGVSRYTLAMVKPQLRAELDRRILASADLIKLHRRDAIDRTLARLVGWSTSIPPGGDGTIDKREVRSTIGKSMAQFKFERRRVDVDQGHKLIANVSNLVATDAGAIAGIWHSHGEHDRSYNARKEHLARAGKLYLIRDSWAHRDGLVKPMHGYMDEIDMVGQLPFCRCFYQYVTSPRRLPDEMLTRAGQRWIEETKARMAA